MAVILSFVVNRTEEVPTINIEIDQADYSNDDIEVKWARLAMRYARQINEVFTIEDLKHIKEVDAHIAFSRCDQDLDEIVESGFMSEFQGLERAPVGNNMSIGFAMSVDCIDTIGGLSTPAPLYATKLYKLLLDARGQVSI
jgi:hypothetical protein